MTKIAVKEAVQRVLDGAKANPKEERFLRVWAKGHVRQGDVYLTECKMPDLKKLKKRAKGDRQVAPGVSEGSRHCVDGNVDIYDDPNSPSQLLGPYIVAHERWNLTHPTHPNVSIPSGVCRVGYQLDMRTRKRALD